jgi:hypothetical protein
VEEKKKRRFKPLEPEERFKVSEFLRINDKRLWAINASLKDVIVKVRMATGVMTKSRHLKEIASEVCAYWLSTDFKTRANCRGCRATALSDWLPMKRAIDRNRDQLNGAPKEFWTRFLGMNGIKVNSRLLDGLNREWRSWEGAK